MPLVPESPFPKEKGQPLRSRDWNQLVTEVQRLDTDKVNKLVGDSMKGPLTIEAGLGIGVTTPRAPLHLAGGNWDVGNTEGDLRIGSDTLRLKIGVATVGGGAGDVRIRAQGGTNRLILGSNADDLLVLQNGTIAVNAALNVANNQPLNFGAQVRQMINLWNTEYGIGVQGNTQYFRTFSNFAWFRGGSHSDAAITPGAGGTLQMCITGSDRVGINTSNPQGRLHVAGVNWGGNPLRITGDTGNVVGPSLDLDATATSGGKNYSIISTGASASVGAGCFSIYDNAGAYRLVIASNGNIGIGTNSPDARLDVNGNAVISGNLSFGAQTRQMINLWSTGYGIGVQSGTYYCRSDSDFAWFRGGVHNDNTQNPGGGARLMALNGSGDLILSARTNPGNNPGLSACRALVDGGNVLVINFGGDYAAGVQIVNGRFVSSRSIKDNITTLSLDEAMRSLADLKPVTYRYKTEDENVRHAGFIAEEVPDLVSNPEHTAIGMLDIVALLTRVVQEQQSTITNLTTKVDQLERQLQS
jgi:Chaperone of endosialidase